MSLLAVEEVGLNDLCRSLPVQIFSDTRRIRFTVMCAAVKTKPKFYMYEEQNLQNIQFQYALSEVDGR